MRMAATGVARSTPIIPATAPPITTEIMTQSGLTFSFDCRIRGEINSPDTFITITEIIIAVSAFTGETRKIVRATGASAMYPPT